MGLTFADLRTPEATSTIRARLAAALVADGVPLASWAPSSAGGVENLRLDMVAGAMAQLMAQRIGNLVNGRMLALATDDPVKGNWLTYYGKKFYELDKQQATKTIQNVALYLKPGSAAVSYTFQPGDLWVASSLTGNRYQSITGGKFGSANATLATALMLSFQAENVGSTYNDPAGTLTQMITARAGVQCVNVRLSDFTTAKVNGPSTGKIVGSFTVPGSPPAFFSSVRVRIDVTGEVGGGAFSYLTDFASNWTSAGPLRTTFLVPGGATLTFSNGTAPSFIAGDIFTLFVGDAILSRGSDAEADAAFRQRCRNRWPAISLTPVAGTLDLWCRLASLEVNRTAVDADPNVPGGMLVTIATSQGPASAQALIAVEDYILARLKGFQGVPAATGFTSPAETVQVASASALNIIPAGKVQVAKANIATAQITWANAWNAYLLSLPLGGQVGAVVELAKLQQTLADAGAIDVINPTLNGIAGDITVPVGQVATLAASSLVWQPI